MSGEEKPDTNVQEAITKPPANHEYVIGHKSAAVVTCVALGCFLMLVYTMVISTVSIAAESCHTRTKGFDSDPLLGFSLLA